MEQINFILSDFEALAKYSPEAWLYINNVRLMREKAEVDAKLAELTKE